MLIEVFSTGPVETNTILLGCLQTHKAAIVDAPLDSVSLLLDEIRKNSLEVQMILLTHSHWDHTAEVAALKEKLHVPLYVHAEDAGNVEHPGSDGLPLLFPIKGVKPDGFLQDGEEILIGSLQLKVIHTPGHTPGAVCFWLPKEEVLISGDTLFRGTIGNLSFPTARPSLMGESLKKLAKLPPKTRVIPGHGEETTIEAEAISTLNSRRDLFLRQ